MLKLSDLGDPSGRVLFVSFGGMGIAMDFQQFAQTRSAVDLCGIEFFVAEDCLDRAEVCSVVMHKCGHRVAKDVIG